MNSEQQPSSVAGDWMSPGRFCLILLAGIVASNPDVVFGAATFVWRDFGFFGYPLAHYHRESFWRGEIPLWNPYNNLGLPFLAQWNTLTLYPLSLIYLLLPLAWSLAIFCLAHQFLAGIGMYLLAAEWTGNRVGAAVAGIVFAFNGLAVNCLMWPNNIAAMAWLPWMILLLHRALFVGGRHIALAVLAGGLQMLTGAPEIILLTWMMCAVFGAVVVIQSAGRRLLTAARLSIVPLLVTAFAAAQLLPFLQLLRHSQRSLHFGTTVWSMPPWGWANFFVPVFGSYQNDAGGKFFGVFFQYGQYWTSSYYVGVLTLVAAAIAAWRVRTPRVWVLAALSGFSLILVLGDAGPLYSAVRNLVPQLGLLRYPIKFVVIAIFCFPLLAAYGVAFCLQSREPRDFRLLLGGSCAALLLIWAVVWFCFQFPLDARNPSVTLINGVVRSLFLIAMTAALLALPRARRRSEVLVCLVAMMAGLWADFLTHTARQNPTISPAAYQPGVALQNAAFTPRPGNGISRVMLSSEAFNRFKYFFSGNVMADYLRSRMGLFSNCNLLESNLPKIDGFFSLYINECDQVVSRLYQTPAEPVLDFLGASHVTAPGKDFVWQRRPGFMPLATSGQQPRLLPEREILDRLFEPGFRPREWVYLAGEVSNHGIDPNQRYGSAEIRTLQATPHSIQFDTMADKPSLVVISQAHYPAWQARVDGKRQEILRANRAFQAVQVPAGHHRLQLQYRDHWFLAGVGISLATFLFLAAWLWRTRPPMGTRE